MKPPRLRAALRVAFYAERVAHFDQGQCFLL
jgi:hypothetical protein